MDVTRKSYGVFHAVAGISELAAWIAFAVGVLIAIIGFTTGGLFDSIAPPFGGPNIDLFVHILATLPGIGVCLSALFFITVIQYFRAGVDTASMTAELVRIARRQEALHSAEHDVSLSSQYFAEGTVEDPTTPPSVIVEQEPAPFEDTIPPVVKVHEFDGVKIYETEKGFFVDGNRQEYISLEVAQKIVHRGGH